MFQIWMIISLGFFCFTTDDLLFFIDGKLLNNKVIDRNLQIRIRLLRSLLKIIPQLCCIILIKAIKTEADLHPYRSFYRTSLD